MLIGLALLVSLPWSIIGIIMFLSTLPNGNAVIEWAAVAVIIGGAHVNTMWLCGYVAMWLCGYLAENHLLGRPAKSVVIIRRSVIPRSNHSIKRDAARPLYQTLVFEKVNVFSRKELKEKVS